jgi:arylsulfatase
MVISDNGASAEGGPTGTTNEAQFFNNAPQPLEDSLKRIDEIGGPKTFNHYPWGWTWAGNTPFRRWKRETYRGGVSDPFLVHWPKGIKAKGEVRTQYAHIIDMVPTVLDMLGIDPPTTIRGVTQSPLQGVSLAQTFDTPTAASLHHTQYFEMLGHRAVYHDGWRAVCPWPGPSFTEAGVGFGQPISAQTLSELDGQRWELYHVEEDFAENHNVAADNRDKLIELIATWYVEAGKYGVMPIDGSGLARMIAEKPAAAPARDRYTYIQNTHSVPFFAGPRVLNRPHSITATVDIPDGAEGVLLSQGSAAGGYSLFVQDGRLHYVHNSRRSQPAPRLISGPGTARNSRTALRIRADRPAGPAPRTRRTGTDAALHRQHARRRRRHTRDHAVRPQPRRADLRRQPWLAGNPRLPITVPIHRNPAQGHRRRVR